MIVQFSLLIFNDIVFIYFPFQTRLTFTTCGLNSKETALVTKLAQMTKSCLTKDFTHNTTHLVIGATGRGKLEYYLAIAYRAFIVSMDWVTLCLALNKILPVVSKQVS